MTTVVELNEREEGLPLKEIRSMSETVQSSSKDSKQWCEGCCEFMDRHKKLFLLLLLTALSLFFVITKLYLASKLIMLSSLEEAIFEQNSVKFFGIFAAIEASITLISCILIGFYWGNTGPKRFVARCSAYNIFFVNTIMLLAASIFFANQLATQPLYSPQLTPQAKEAYYLNLKEISNLTEMPNSCSTDPTCLETYNRIHFRTQVITFLAGLVLLYYLSLVFCLLFSSANGNLLNICTALDMWNFVSASILIISFAYAMKTDQNATRVVLWCSVYIADYIGWFLVGILILALMISLAIFSIFFEGFSLGYRHFQLIFLITLVAFLGGIIRIGLQWNTEYLIDGQYLNYFNSHYAQKEYEVYTASWDLVQQEYQCCGFNGPTDYLHTVWYNSSTKGLPTSCCSETFDGACQDYKFSGPVEGVYQQGCLQAMPNFSVESQFRVLVILTLTSLFCMLTYMRSMVYKTRHVPWIALGLHLLASLLLIITGVLGIQFVKGSAKAEKIFGESGTSMVISGIIVCVQLLFIGASLKWRRKALKRTAYICPILISGMLLLVSCRKLVSYKRGLSAFEPLKLHLKTGYFASLDSDYRHDFEVLEAATYWQVVTTFTCYALSLIYSSLWHEIMLRRRASE
ncbi:hypothetical protein Ciccas_010291 [Cichlidogyrus casuarinus]|uniref:Tetraspanin n=1 Tax=Cichlidogyrus casuarinus TaxID=1844966 RepID=A0ABD2PUL6_9PLAT